MLKEHSRRMHGVVSPLLAFCAGVMYFASFRTMSLQPSLQQSSLYNQAVIQASSSYLNALTLEGLSDHGGLFCTPPRLLTV